MKQLLAQTRPKSKPELGLDNSGQTWPKKHRPACNPAGLPIPTTAQCHHAGPIYFPLLLPCDMPYTTASFTSQLPSSCLPRVHSMHAHDPLLLSSTSSHVSSATGPVQQAYTLGGLPPASCSLLLLQSHRPNQTYHCSSPSCSWPPQLQLACLPSFPQGPYVQAATYPVPRQHSASMHGSNSRVPSASMKASCYHLFLCALAHLIFS